MIDTKELRRLVQAATPGPWIAAGPSFGESLPKYLNEVVVDREGDEDDCYSICGASIGLDKEGSDDMAFIAAVNPSAISELLDRLEAAENDAAHQKALAESALRVAEGWERKCGELRARIEALEHDDFGALPDDVVEQAVNRFLSWKLPKDFHPDGGMAFIPTKGRGYDNQPVQRFVGRRNAQELEPAMQDALMKFDPATGEERPYPSHATQWRNWHGSAAWLFDPWTGRRRNAHDVGSDVRGLLIAPAGTLGMDMGGGCAEAKL